MKAAARKPDSRAILGGLKDFQRHTVEHVFRRLYLDEDYTRRFLIADEVGLGKTLVARGVVAKAIDHLWDKVDRVDIVYICSNADIARQNIARLNVTGQSDFALPSRITLLPKYVSGLTSNRLNFVAFTPGTSFHLKSSTGVITERAVLYRLLKRPWGLHGKAPRHVLRSRALIKNFDWHCEQALSDETQIDPELEAAFLRKLDEHHDNDCQSGTATLHARFQHLCRIYERSDSRVSQEDQRERDLWIGEIRKLLAKVCFDALNPDVIILDEFQRFRELLDAESDAGMLAENFFRYTSEEKGNRARVLLLSATPYKMYSMAHEEQVDNHYSDFLNTLRFLTDDANATDEFQTLFQAYSRAFFQHGGVDVARLMALKGEIESRLRKVMVRTEKLSVTEDRDGMLQQVNTGRPALSPGDVRAFIKQQALADELEHPSILEYWKSAPYLFNFMDQYVLKRRFEQAAARKQRQQDLSPLLRDSKAILLRHRDITHYREIDPANAKLRKLLEQTVQRGMWRLLWMPPSLPYYQLAGAFAEEACRSITKRLIFSAWKVVPKAIAALVSYEAERQAILSLDPDARNTLADRKSRRPLLRFAFSDGRLTGLPVLGMIYPAARLAELCDPLALRRASNGMAEPTLDDMLQEAVRRVSQALKRLDATEEASGPPDERWYWAAPVLLDLAAHPAATADWFAQDGLSHHWRAYTPQREGDDADGRWGDHVEEVRQFVLDPAASNLGRKPADLPDVLARMGLGGLGCCALRAFGRLSSATTALNVSVKNDAGAVAYACLSLFNLPEATAIIRGADAREPYWVRVMDYACNGCLQAVLDEYLHVLKESMGLLDNPVEQISPKLGQAVAEALTMRTSRVNYDGIRVSNKGNGILVKPRNLRIRFALRFGAERDDETGEITREDHVRAAFNSPFWPFVLATTSIGQEGLDFHPYCHAVVHWNLPANPVDMEQREGRLHRYKGHAVRKNLAQLYGAHAWLNESTDPWQTMFEHARATKPPHESEIIPYWVLPAEGGSRIERHVFNLPLSRDEQRLHELRRSLAAYRMVFGQPRQEDMLAYLLDCVPEAELQNLAQTLRINLEPSQR